MLTADYNTVLSTSPIELSKAIYNGIPSVLRGMMWQLLSSSKDEELEALYASMCPQHGALTAQNISQWSARTSAQYGVICRARSQIRRTSRTTAALGKRACTTL